MTSRVITADSFAFEEVGDPDLARGLAVAVMAGAAEGSVHLEVALSRLDPGGTVAGHFHFYEESFSILSGEVLVDIEGRRHHLRENDFGVVPAATHHAWHNVSDEPVEWFRMRSPQPRLMRDGSFGTYLSDRVVVPDDGVLVGDPHPAIPYVGHFAEHHLPKPGPIAMRGFRGPNIDNVAVWMLVDDMVGALHHTMFMVQFLEGASTHPRGDHFHPFEEAYYFVQGSAIAHLEGSDLEVNTGDLVFAGTNALHGYTMTGDGPTRWIEVQAPAPTPAGAFIFPADWEQL
jgi:mannose-6-phosphate isomerase-like protein (cupin superfamily)